MKIIYCKILMLLLLVSCQGPDKNQTVQSNTQSKESITYQTEVYQNTPDDFKIISLNKFTGTIYIRESNGIWYNATEGRDLKVYKTPSYSMKIFNGNKLFQIALSDDVTGELFIRSYSTSWYEASRVAIVK